MTQPSFDDEVDRASEPLARAAAEKTCRACGCTEANACLDGDVIPCAWTDKSYGNPQPLCTSCAPSLTAVIKVNEWAPSSNIAGVGWDADTRTMEVRFRNGSGYRYGNVPSELAAPLLTAKPGPGFSPGAYLSRQFVKDPVHRPYAAV